jgi:ATP-binding cassette subfamily G (WHITE) protein 4
VLQTVVLGLLIGLAFLHLGADQVAVQNRLGCVYFIVICVIFANTLAVVLNCKHTSLVILVCIVFSFPSSHWILPLLVCLSWQSVAEERQVFLREQSNRMYSVASYFMARTSIEIIPTFLCSLGLALICFWMIGQTQLLPASF